MTIDALLKNWMNRAAVSVLLLSLLFVSSCNRDETSASNQASSSTATAPSSQPGVPSTLHFTDITAKAGIDMVMSCGKIPAQQILEVNGGGLGLIDFDNDGDLDLFVANGATLDDPEHGPGCRLYENLTYPPTQGSGPPRAPRFRDITAQAGIDIHRWAMGAAVGNYDGDGFDDIYITCYGPNILLHN